MKCLSDKMPGAEPKAKIVWPWLTAIFPAELSSGCHDHTKLQGQYGDDHNNSSAALRVRDVVACPPGQVHPSSFRPASVQEKDMERLSILLCCWPGTRRRKLRGRSRQVPFGSTLSQAKVAQVNLAMAAVP